MEKIVEELEHVHFDKLPGILFEAIFALKSTDFKASFQGNYSRHRFRPFLTPFLAFRLSHILADLPLGERVCNPAGIKVLASWPDSTRPEGFPGQH